jgi:phospholipid/cholesterol/gamma-HCH transport system permease protein
MKTADMDIVAKTNGKMLSAIPDVLNGLGARTVRRIEAFGDFCIFCARTLGWITAGLFQVKNLRLLMAQFFAIGTLSIPVVMITGAFVGMVLAVQTVMQFKAIGMEAHMGTIVNLSVLRELGPVLAGVMLAGRVGGGLTAEVGTMRVTEQIDALAAMGASPLRVLVVPRFLASMLLTPVLVIYADFMGILGGYVVSVYVYGVNGAEFWRLASVSVDNFDIFYGPIKSIFFGAVMSLICCYKGFRCAPGAAGVGKACTESFVESCMAILALDFFLGMFLNTLYESAYGLKVVL